MSLKTECPSKWNVTQNGIPLNMECHSKKNVTKFGMSLKMECPSNWNVTQNGISLKMKCHSKWNVTQPPTIECWGSMIHVVIQSDKVLWAVDLKGISIKDILCSNYQLD